MITLTENTFAAALQRERPPVVGNAHAVDILRDAAQLMRLALNRGERSFELGDVTILHGHYIADDIAAVADYLEAGR